MENEQIVIELKELLYMEFRRYLYRRKANVTAIAIALRFGERHSNIMESHTFGVTWAILVEIRCWQVTWMMLVLS